MAIAPHVKEDHSCWNEYFQETNPDSVDDAFRAFVPEP